MVSKIIVLVVASIAAVAQGTGLHNVLVERSLLQPRAECLVGATTCSIQGTTRYCANPGNKCCDAQNSAPIAATCCPFATFARPGTYCCAEGGSCTNGRTCRDCTPVSGSAGTSPSIAALPSLPVTTPAPATSTRVAPPSQTYYTFTITYYYWQLYYIYVASLTRSTATSSSVTTTTTVSVYAANSAAAQSSFSALSATIALPTPASATVLPPLPSQTDEVVLPSATSTTRGPAITPVAPTLPAQFPGGAGRVAGGEGVYGSLLAWVVVSMVGMAGFGINFVL